MKLGFPVQLVSLLLCNYLFDGPNTAAGHCVFVIFSFVLGSIIFFFQYIIGVAIGFLILGHAAGAMHFEVFRRIALNLLLPTLCIYILFVLLMNILFVYYTYINPLDQSKDFQAPFTEFETQSNVREEAYNEYEELEQKLTKNFSKSKDKNTKNTIKNNKNLKLTQLNPAKLLDKARVVDEAGTSSLEFSPVPGHVSLFNIIKIPEITNHKKASNCASIYTATSFVNSLKDYIDILALCSEFELFKNDGTLAFDLNDSFGAGPLAQHMPVWTHHLSYMQIRDVLASLNYHPYSSQPNHEYTRERTKYIRYAIEHWCYSRLDALGALALIAMLCPENVTNSSSIDPAQYFVHDNYTYLENRDFCVTDALINKHKGECVMGDPNMFITLFDLAKIEKITKAKLVGIIKSTLENAETKTIRHVQGIIDHKFPPFSTIVKFRPGTKRVPASVILSRDRVKVWFLNLLPRTVYYLHHPDNEQITFNFVKNLVDNLSTQISEFATRYAEVFLMDAESKNSVSAAKSKEFANILRSAECQIMFNSGVPRTQVFDKVYKGHRDVLNKAVDKSGTIVVSRNIRKAKNKNDIAQARDDKYYIEYEPESFPRIDYGVVASHLGFSIFMFAIFYAMGNRIANFTASMRNAFNGFINDARTCFRRVSAAAQRVNGTINAIDEAVTTWRNPLLLSFDRNSHPEFMIQLLEVKTILHMVYEYYFGTRNGMLMWASNLVVTRSQSVLDFVMSIPTPSDPQPLNDGQFRPEAFSFGDIAVYMSTMLKDNGIAGISESDLRRANAEFTYLRNQKANFDSHYQAFIAIIRNVSLLLFAYDPFDPEFQRFSSRVLSMIGEVKKWQVDKPKNREQYTIVLNLYKEYQDLETSKFAEQLPSYLKNVLSSRYAQLVSMAALCKNKLLGDVSRPEPVALIVSGGAGSGKTSLVTQIKAILAAKHYNNEIESYTYNQDAAYFEGYSNQPFVCMDDVFVSADGAKRAEIITQLICMINSAPYALDMAFEQKGLMFFNSPYIFMTTNALGPNKVFTAEVSDMEAFTRRMHLHVHRDEPRVDDDDTFEVVNCVQFPDLNGRHLSAPQITKVLDAIRYRHEQHHSSLLNRDFNSLLNRYHDAVIPGIPDDRVFQPAPPRAPVPENEQGLFDWLFTRAAKLVYGETPNTANFAPQSNERADLEVERALHGNQYGPDDIIWGVEPDPDDDECPPNMPGLIPISRDSPVSDSIGLTSTKGFQVNPHSPIGTLRGSGEFTSIASTRKIRVTQAKANRLSSLTIDDEPVGGSGGTQSEPPSLIPNTASAMPVNTIAYIRSFFTVLDGEVVWWQQSWVKFAVCLFLTLSLGLVAVKFFFNTDTGVSEYGTESHDTRHKTRHQRVSKHKIRRDFDLKHKRYKTENKKMVSDPNDRISRCVVKFVVRYEVQGKPMVNSATAIHLGSGIFMYPQHFHLDIEPYDINEFCVVSNSGSYTMDYNADKIISYGNKDMLTIRLDMQNCLPADCRKYLVSADVAESLGVCEPGANMELKSRTDYGEPVSKAGSMCGVLKTSSLGSHGGRIMLENPLKYTAQSINGDSGSAVMMVANNQAHYVVGMHVGKIGDMNLNMSCGLAEIITKELVQVIFDLYGVDFDIVAGRHTPTEYDTTSNVRDFPFEVKEVVLNGMTIPRKTKIRSSVLHGYDGPTTVAPAQLMPFELDGRIVDPAILSLSKLSRRHAVVVDCARGPILDFLFHHYPRCPQHARLLSAGEILDGSYELGLPGIDGTTSAGYPFCLSGTKGKSPHIIFDGERHSMSRELEQLVHDCEVSLQRGEPIGVIWADVLKDETRPLAKVAAGKTRLIATCPVHFLLLVRKYFGGFLAFVRKFASHKFVSVGLNVHSREWEVLYNRFLAKSNPNKWSIIAGDFENYDGNVSAKLGSIFIDYVNSWYDDGANNARVRQLLFNNMVEPIRIHGNIVYQVFGGNTSGNPITSEYNSFVQAIMWYGIATRLNISPYDMEMALYGDDNLVSLPLPGITTNTLAPLFRELFSMSYTHCSKQVVDVFDDLSSVTYLGRKFLVYDHRGVFADKRVVLAPLSLETIREILYYVRGAPSKELTNTIQSLTSCQLELSHHPCDVYSSQMSKIVSAIESRYTEDVSRIMINQLNKHNYDSLFNAKYSLSGNKASTFTYTRHPHDEDLLD